MGTFRENSSTSCGRETVLHHEPRQHFCLLLLINLPCEPSRVVSASMRRPFLSAMSCSWRRHGSFGSLHIEIAVRAMRHQAMLCVRISVRSEQAFVQRCAATGGDIYHRPKHQRERQQNLPPPSPYLPIRYDSACRVQGIPRAR